MTGALTRVGVTTLEMDSPSFDFRFFYPLLLVAHGKQLFTCFETMHVVTGRAESRRARQPSQDLLRCLALHDRFGQGIHVFVDRHPHHKRQRQLGHHLFTQIDQLLDQSVRESCKEKTAGWARKPSV